MLFVLDVVGEILLASDGGVWFEFLDWTVVSLLGSSAITVAAWVVKLANLISNDEVWTVLPMVSSTECSEIWWLKTNCCSSAGYADGGDGPVCWASSTGDGWTTALVFEVADPSGGRAAIQHGTCRVPLWMQLPSALPHAVLNLQLLMALGSGCDVASGLCALKWIVVLVSSLWKYYVAVEADA
ncbi:hypothetical protein Nepgr_016350 [Nepenthes gracilis]|uniref:Uncharacterized protein n=1 Tax=Nepenthes gracilis TaxID=150966 RepID=A0AAD3SPJ3_NEPGR|nr:hypothetical protein Nepgr_016350 [Nepenthes gracilis]